MLDCGFNLRQTELRLGRLGVQPKAVSAIVVTHEHQDHAGGVFRFARRHGIPVWMSLGTYQALAEDRNGVEVNICRDGHAFSVGDIALTPYTVPHDAREPLQYCASDGRRKLGVLTDAGQSTAHMVEALVGCDALVLECNHDRTLLDHSAYPAFLKQRIKSALGHLSNQEALEILTNLDQSRLKKVIGAHLSTTNNRPDLARKALQEGIRNPATGIGIACQQEGFGWVAVSD